MYIKHKLHLLPLVSNELYARIGPRVNIDQCINKQIERSWAPTFHHDRHDNDKQSITKQYM